MRGRAPGNGRVRARRGEEKDTVRDLPGAAALEKAKEQSSAFRAFLCVGDAPGLSPCPGKQELSAGTHPERTACVRASNADTNTVRDLPGAAALEKAKEQSSAFRAFLCVRDAPGLSPCPGKQKPGVGPAPGKNRVRARLKCRHKHGARLARRRRAGKKQTGRTALQAADALQAATRVTSLPLQTGACANCPAQPRDLLTAAALEKAKEQSSAFRAFLCVTYSRRYPAICQQTDADPETGRMEFDIEKGRFSFRLTAPYSEERRRAASEAAKAAASNLTRSMV